MYLLLHWSSVVQQLPCHMQWSPLVAKEPAHGTKSIIQCDANYRLGNEDNATKSICLDTIWVPSLFKCESIRNELCLFLKKPTYGEVSLTGLSFGSKAHYVCHKGYCLDGEKERTCKGRVWGGTRPRCQPLRCPAPRYGKNGEYVPCPHINYTKTYGTFRWPREGYCYTSLWWNISAKPRILWTKFSPAMGKWLKDITRRYCL